jgi:hypothetical protein
MSGWHVPTMMNVLTKYNQFRLNGNRETDLITKTWGKFNKVSRPWKVAFWPKEHNKSKTFPSLILALNVPDDGYSEQTKLIIFGQHIHHGGYMSARHVSPDLDFIFTVLIY